MNIVKTCVLRPFSYTFGFDFGLFYENKNFLDMPTQNLLSDAEKSENVS